MIARPISEWHEDFGDVLWWKFPINEPPYVGSPLDQGQPIDIMIKAYGVEKHVRVNLGGWPGYHTHWTPLPEEVIEFVEDPDRPQSLANQWEA